MPQLKPCAGCSEVSDHCASSGKCYVINKAYETYLVHSCAQQTEKVQLDEPQQWKERCRLLQGNLDRLTHYAKDMADPGLFKKAQPLKLTEWPRWIADRAKVYAARNKRSR